MPYTPSPPFPALHLTCQTRISRPTRATHAPACPVRYAPLPCFSSPRTPISSPKRLTPHSSPLPTPNHPAPLHTEHLAPRTIPPSLPPLPPLRHPPRNSSFSLLFSLTRLSTYPILPISISISTSTSTSISPSPNSSAPATHLSIPRPAPHRALPCSPSE